MIAGSALKVGFGGQRLLASTSEVVASPGLRHHTGECDMLRKRLACKLARGPLLASSRDSLAIARLVVRVAKDLHYVITFTIVLEYPSHAQQQWVVSSETL